MSASRHSDVFSLDPNEHEQQGFPLIDFPSKDPQLSNGHYQDDVEPESSAFDDASTGRHLGVDHLQHTPDDTHDGWSTVRHSRQPLSVWTSSLYRVQCWLRGPDNPRPYAISACLSRVQTVPIDILEQYCPSHRHQCYLFIFWHFLGMTLFLAILISSLQGCHIAEYAEPIRMSCSSRFWGVCNHEFL